MIPTTCSYYGFSDSSVHSNYMVLFHYTVLALLGLTRLGLVPGTTFSITTVPTQCGRGRHSTAALNCCDFVLYTTQTHGGHGGDGVLAAVCDFLSHTKREEIIIQYIFCQNPWISPHYPLAVPSKCVLKKRSGLNTQPGSEIQLINMWLGPSQHNRQGAFMHVHSLLYSLWVRERG